MKSQRNEHNQNNNNNIDTDIVLHNAAADIGSYYQTHVVVGLKHFLGGPGMK